MVQAREHLGCVKLLVEPEAAESSTGVSAPRGAAKPTQTAARPPRGLSLSRAPSGPCAGRRGQAGWQDAFVSQVWLKSISPPQTMAGPVLP